MAKRALLFGVNYPGSQHALRGCCNDVFRIKGVLEKLYGFSEDDMVILLDDGDGYEKPTGANMRRYLKKMVDDTEPGDILFIHYSGHGTQVPNKGANDETDGKDEALVPTDMNLILDDDIRGILQGLKENVNCTFVADCCHSGTMTDGGNHVISGKKEMTDLPDLRIGQEMVGGHSGARDVPASNGEEKVGLVQKLFGCLSSKAGLGGNSAGAAPAREIPAAELFEILGGMMNGKVDAGNVMGILGSLFGDDAPAKTQGGGGSGSVGDDRFVLISGCQDHETSADMPPTGGKPARGALTEALCTSLEAYAAQNDGKVPSYRTAVLAARNILLMQGVAQNPCLECREENADQPFLRFNS